MNQIKGIFLLLCAVVVAILAFVFYSHRSAIEVQMPLLTNQMVTQREEEMQKEEQRRQTQQEARRRAELGERIVSCQSDDDCIIVDKDPCGCLKGPEGVTAINSAMALEFSRLMTRTFGNTTSCPSVESKEKECSPTAKAVCEQNRCKIVY